MKTMRLPNGKVITVATDDKDAIEALKQLHEQQRIHEEHVANVQQTPPHDPNA